MPQRVNTGARSSTVYADYIHGEHRSHSIRVADEMTTIKRMAPIEPVESIEPRVSHMAYRDMTCVDQSVQAMLH